MIDQIFDRNYQEARHAMNSDLTKAFERLFRSIGAAFNALHRVQWDAPWAARRRDPRSC